MNTGGGNYKIPLQAIVVQYRRQLNTNQCGVLSICQIFAHINEKDVCEI